jgi:hypothetical protein
VIHSICDEKNMSLLVTILNKIAEGVTSFDNFEQFKSKFLELRFPSLSSHIEGLWESLKMDETHSTITSYLNTFKVICGIAGKSPETIECKRKFLNSLKNMDARRNLNKLILEEHSIDYLCLKAEAIAVAGVLETSVQNIDINLATKADDSDGNEQNESKNDELSLAYVNSKSGYDIRKQNPSEQTPIQFIKKYNINFDTCIQCLRKGQHKMAKCFLKRCLFCGAD